MKRIAAFLTALILVASMMVVPTFAAGAATLYASAVQGAPGRTVTVDVGVKNNPGMVTMSFTMNFDTSVLKLVGVNSTDLLNGAMPSPDYGSPYKVTFGDYNRTTDLKTNGVLMRFTFEILEDAPAGQTPISLTYNDSYKTDMKTKNDFTAENGSVDVLPAGTAVVAAVVANGAEASQYTTVQAAVNACATSGNYVKLLADTEETVTGTKNLYLDLAGHTLSGSISLGTRTLNGMDSSTDTYAVGTGKLAASVTGKVAGTVKVAAPYLASGQVRRYLAIKGSDNSYTFNRFYIGVTAIALDGETGEVGFSTAVAGNDLVKDALQDSDAFGIRVWTSEEGETMTSAQARDEDMLQEISLEKDEFKSGAAGNKKKVTVENQLDVIDEDPEYYQGIPVYAEVYIHFNGTSEVVSATYSYSICEMFQMMDAAFPTWNEANKGAVKGLYEQYSYMEDWNLTNIAAY